MNKTVTSIIILTLIIIGGLFLFGGDNKNTQVENTSSSQPTGIMVDSGQTVVIQGHQIPKGDLEIEVGTTIIWRNKDNLVGLPYDRHTVTSGAIDKIGTDDGVNGVVPNSGSGISDGLYQEGLALNDVFDYTFTEPGIYTFYIAEHPLVSGEGKIVVTERTSSISGETIAMESKSFSFSPDTLQANVGEVVDLNITSTGQHTFTIDELGVDVITPHGETARVEFTPEQTGTFQFYCAIPGHREAGQVGTIVVE